MAAIDHSTKKAGNPPVVTSSSNRHVTCSSRSCDAVNSVPADANAFRCYECGSKSKVSSKIERESVTSRFGMSDTQTDDLESVVHDATPQSVSERKQKEKAAAEKLPILYVDAPEPGKKQKIVVPPGGARVVVRGQEGQQVQMVPKQPKVQRQTTTRYVDSSGRPVQTVQTGNGQVIVVQQQPQVVYAPAPYYDPYYYPYGYRRYGYGYGYGYPYAGFGTGLLLGACLF